MSCKSSGLVLMRVAGALGILCYGFLPPIVYCYLIRKNKVPISPLQDSTTNLQLLQKDVEDLHVSMNFALSGIGGFYFWPVLAMSRKLLLASILSSFPVHSSYIPLLVVVLLIWSAVVQVWLCLHFKANLILIDFLVQIKYAPYASRLDNLAEPGVLLLVTGVYLLRILSDSGQYFSNSLTSFAQSGLKGLLFLIGLWSISKNIYKRKSRRK